MTASDYASFSLVLCGFWFLRWVQRRAMTNDRFHVSAKYLRDLRRKGE